uniref:MalT-like TPR region domain-containing protein n=1 Tax=Chromera velia CCMP2878 TaxID=1169474 RepID=A0A0G4HM34_9ALVE|eukprot:Cvel_28962.t1-p1 / transcript=Cvel_28962.t1 / gene=Cvel_28962 / organism=Chromera_velia_CCMP2878 / gene_product=hypothetical protein / transcript_product=hypothetical protein / location=Cvel_scaffold3888:2393-8252(+) / protein_length=759 / sequence_SO=supercontig / SO=protein_coding / is_pseudo=false
MTSPALNYPKDIFSTLHQFSLRGDDQDGPADNDSLLQELQQQGAEHADFLSPEQEIPHPEDLLLTLEEEYKEAEANDLKEGAIECRIKQLAVVRILIDVHGYCLSALVQAHLKLSEAYAAAKFPDQANNHLSQAEFVLGEATFAPSEGDPQGMAGSVRKAKLTVAALTTSALLAIERKEPSEAEKCLYKAMSIRTPLQLPPDSTLARVHELMGRTAALEKKHMIAIENFRLSLEVFSAIFGPSSPEAVRLSLLLAKSLWSKGGVQGQKAAIEGLQLLLERAASAAKGGCTPSSAFIRMATTLAEWQEKKGLGAVALVTHEEAEKWAEARFGRVHSASIEVKRRLLLCRLRQGKTLAATEKLQEVHRLEAELFGAHSLQTAYTLKTLGSLLIALKRYWAALQHLKMALERFQIAPGQSAMTGEMHAKIKSLQTFIRQNRDHLSPPKSASLNHVQACENTRHDLSRTPPRPRSPKGSRSQSPSGGGNFPSAALDTTAHARFICGGGRVHSSRCLNPGENGDPLDSPQVIQEGDGWIVVTERGDEGGAEERVQQQEDQGTHPPLPKASYIPSSYPRRTDTVSTLGSTYVVAARPPRLNARLPPDWPLAGDANGRNVPSRSAERDKGGDGHAPMWVELNGPPPADAADVVRGGSNDFGSRVRDAWESQGAGAASPSGHRPVSRLAVAPGGQSEGAVPKRSNSTEDLLREIEKKGKGVKGDEGSNSNLKGPHVGGGKKDGLGSLKERCLEDFRAMIEIANSAEQ